MRDDIIIEDLRRMRQTDLPWQQLDGKTVLVTGATGMLASYVSWLLLRLHEEAGIDVSVVALCRNPQKAEQYYGSYVGKPYFRMLIQDVCDPIVYDGAVDYIFHLSGNASPHFINTDPVGIMRCNLLGTVNVLELARKKETAKVIFASTREVYGANEHADKLDECSYGVLDPLDARSCYPESKRAAETLLESYNLQYGVAFNTIRIAHAYGPTMTLENDGRVMADLLSDVVTGRNIVLKSAGDAIRAFLYITDAVIGMFTILFHANPSTAYNLANETEPISIRDLARLLISLRKDIDLKVVYDTLQQDPPKGYCSYKRIALDTSKLEALGWSSHISLQEGLSRTVSTLLHCS